MNVIIMTVTLLLECLNNISGNTLCRVWEKFMDRIKELAPTSGFKAKIGLWAKDIGLRGNMNMQTGLVLYLLLNSIV